MDLMFCEVIEFRLVHTVVMRCRIAPSQEEVLRQMMAEAGLELVDYGSFTIQPIIQARAQTRETQADLVSAYSRAYRERRERETLALRD